VPPLALAVVISVLDTQQREARGQLVDVVIWCAAPWPREQQGQARLGLVSTVWSSQHALGAAGRSALSTCGLAWAC